MLCAIIAIAWFVIVFYNLPGILRIPTIPPSRPAPRTPGTASCAPDVPAAAHSAAIAKAMSTGSSTSIHNDMENIEARAERAGRVSVIIAARNEQQTIERTLASLVRQSVPLREIIVVDDRSNDATAGQVRQAARRWPWANIRPIAIHTLPDGWIGKNHALYVGARAASGDWLLFADADVYFHPDAVERAVSFAERHRLDHLTVAPRVSSHGTALRLLTGFFALMLLLFARPHYAIRKRSGAYTGIGAFNLLRRAVYHAAGTHQAMRLRPDDDIYLGKLVKKAGYRQCFALADAFIEIQWYSSFGDMLRGMEKAPLAAMRYSAALLLLDMAALILLFGGLYAGVMFEIAVRAGLAPSMGASAGAAFGSVSGGLCMGALLLLLGVDALVLRYLRFPLYHIILLPVALMLYVFAFLRAMFLLKRRGGLLWRDSYYRLEELRRGLRA